MARGHLPTVRAAAARMVGANAAALRVGLPRRTVDLSTASAWRATRRAARPAAAVLPSALAGAGRRVAHRAAVGRWVPTAPNFTRPRALARGPIGSST